MKHLNTHSKSMLDNVWFVLNIDLMLNSLEYLLPLCGVRVVRWSFSVDRWRNCCADNGGGTFFFFFLLVKETLRNNLVVWRKKKNNIKKSVGDVVYIDLHKPPHVSAVKPAVIFSMNSKENW